MFSSEDVLVFVAAAAAAATTEPAVQLAGRPAGVVRS